MSKNDNREHMSNNLLCRFLDAARIHMEIHRLNDRYLPFILFYVWNSV